jgi:Ca2+-binding EF-hand superfamily protein
MTAFLLEGAAFGIVFAA